MITQKLLHCSMLSVLWVRFTGMTSITSKSLILIRGDTPPFIVIRPPAAPLVPSCTKPGHLTVNLRIAMPRKKGGEICAAIGCHNTRYNSNVSMFRFPKDVQR